MNKSKFETSSDDSFNDDTIQTINSTNTYIKKKINTSPITINNLPNILNINMNKVQTYFSNNDENIMKEALKNYCIQQNSSKIISNNNNINKSPNHKNHKSKSIKLESKDFAINGREPFSTIKTSYKIKAKNFDYDTETDSNEEDFSEKIPIVNHNNITSMTLSNSSSKNSSFINLDLTKNNNKKLNNTDIENLDIIIPKDTINFENLLIFEKLYEDLIKDVELNKMEIYQNKLSIIEDFFTLINDENNIKFFKNFNLYSEINNSIQKNVKDFLIQQILFFYILLLISLIKKEKDFYLSGIKNLTFIYHQNLLCVIFICILKIDEKNNEDESFKKCIKKIDENKIWLNKNNFKSIMNKNNKSSKSILKNCINFIKIYFDNQILNSKNEKNENNNNIENEDDSINYIETNINLINAYLKSFKKQKIENIIHDLKTSPSIIKLFEKTKYLNQMDNDILLSSLNLKIPFLPEIKNNFQYTLVLDLDETLVHYIEDEESAYIQVRPGAEDFIFDLSLYFEIVIFTAALQKYADLAIDGLDPNNKVSYRLYRQHTMCVGNGNIKDLNKLGRDLKKTIIIDNSSENFSLQPKNGLHIKDFIGDENDNELDCLKEDLINMIKNNPDDIRDCLSEIQKKMDNRL